MPTHEEEMELDILGLSFATRLLLSELDQEVMVERALESMADLGPSPNGGLLLLDQLGEVLEARGILSENQFHKSSLKVQLRDTPLGTVVEGKRPVLFPLGFRESIPWPGEEPHEQGRQCLAAPLVAANNKVVGLAMFDCPASATEDDVLSQPMLMFLTVVAVGLETARLFNLAVNDGLTGLYVRRFFDLRLSEEMARVKRYGGQLSLLVMDIDHFKNFNDTYGHLVGDLVLTELARLLRESVRAELDVVCRYGGEEFVVIMPSTEKQGALVVGERIRRRCEEHAFDSPSGPLKVTISGGIADVDQDSYVDQEELFRRADEALYQAKESGRNRIGVWGS